MPDELPDAEGPGGDSDTRRDRTDADPDGAVSPPSSEPGDGETPVRGSVTGWAAWRRLGLMGRPRATRANVIVGLLALALGFAIAAQVRQTDLEGLANLREEELVRILDNVTQENSRLSGEIRELEQTRSQLAAGATSEEARAAAQARLDSIQVLSGTVAATGPGIVLTVTDPERQVSAALLLDTLQELRDAGAEAVEINGVRVVASTYFTDLDDGVTVSGQPIRPPYVIRAIGDPPTMAAAMDIPGGVRESVRRLNADATIDQRDSLDITSLHSPTTPQYARPVPSPTS
ncbi:DUF881 domain-containing protein [Nostocoides sp. F2B08]|nr:DUF881 domain-containing protein [Tetrasphaera sp. F2B08]